MPGDLRNEDSAGEPSEGTSFPPRITLRTGGNGLQSLLQSIMAMQGLTDVRSDGTSGAQITLDELRALLQNENTSAEEEADDDAMNEDVEEEDDDAMDYWGGARSHNWFLQPKEPQEAGVALLKSGEFGRTSKTLSGRRTNLGRAATRTPIRHNLYKESLASDLVPNSNGTAVAVYDSNIYTGQYSADSSFYYTCSQDFRLHIYDTTAAPRSSRGANPTHANDSLQTTLKLKRRIQATPGRWTITDANLSPGNERMVYSSIHSTAYLTSTVDENPVQIPIPFGDASMPRSAWSYGDNFGIWSCRFSADGNEIIAGGSGKIFVYDLLANQRTVKISAHEDDVNSCCWADTSSGNVLVSASDDTFLKVWDRRSLGASRKPSGVLVGHTEGITYVSAKGDGRYVISNGKDQALRLWDLRKMHTSHDFDTKIKSYNYGNRNFDYRYSDSHYPKPKHKAHPQDCSVMTYRGHAVLRTLIRCHFSPAETTGAQYIYSGSADGKIHIYSLDGRIVQVLDRAATQSMACDPSGPERPYTSERRAPLVCVRDVSWHSQEPVLMSAGWDNRSSGSIVARHEWKGLSKMRGSLEDWNEKQELERQEMERKRLGYRRRRGYSSSMPGGFWDGDDDDDSDYVP